MSRSPHPRRRALRLGAAALAVVSLGLSACGSDDDDSAADDTTTTAPEATTTTAAAAGASEEYCALAQQINEQPELPSAEQLEEYEGLAPDAVADAVAVVVEAFGSADGDPAAIFGDPATVAAIEEITAFEAEACGFEPPQDPDSAQVDPDATRIDVTASDYAFELDLPTEAGRYSFVMANEGAEPHLLVLAQLEPGATLEDVLASQGEEGVVTSFESGVAAPGAEAVVTADLAPGAWVMVCPIPDAEGTTHVEHGMIQEFTVS